MTSQLLTVKPDGDGSLIQKLNSHMSAKDPTGNSKARAGKSILEMLKEGY